MSKRIALWKSRPLSSKLLRLALYPVPYTWVAAIIQALVLIAISYFFQSLPPPGIAVAVLGLAAAIMAVRGPKFTKLEEVTWIGIAFLLCWVEMGAIQSDRAVQEIRHHQELVSQQNDVQRSLGKLVHVEKTTDDIKKDQQKQLESNKLPPNKKRALELSRAMFDFAAARNRVEPRLPIDATIGQEMAFKVPTLAWVNKTTEEFRSRFRPAIQSVLQDAQVERIDFSKAQDDCATEIDPQGGRATSRFVTDCAVDINEIGEKMLY